MKKVNNLVNLIIFLSVIIFLTTIDDFLSLHDINKDYISQSALKYLETETTKSLPNWTNTKLEWLAVTISWIVRFSLIIVSLILLFVLKKKLRKV